MTDIYIVVASGGSYDDAWSNNMFATTDKVVAEAKRAELEAEHVKLGEDLEKFYQFCRALDEELGPVELEARLDWPRWKSGIAQVEITQAMRNERTKIQLKNEQIVRKNAELHQARQAIIRPREEAFLASLGYEPGHRIYNRWRSHSEVNYTVDEVEMI